MRARWSPLHRPTATARAMLAQTMLEVCHMSSSHHSGLRACAPHVGCRAGAASLHVERGPRRPCRPCARERVPVRVPQSPFVVTLE
eukprot:4439593-Prymnesium_polylepis.2